VVLVAIAVEALAVLAVFGVELVRLKLDEHGTSPVPFRKWEPRPCPSIPTVPAETAELTGER